MLACETTRRAPFDEKELFGIWIKARCLMALEGKLLDMIHDCVRANDVKELVVVSNEVSGVEKLVAIGAILANDPAATTWIAYLRLCQRRVRYFAFERGVKHRTIERAWQNSR